MSVYPPKRSLSAQSNRPRLVFDEQHQFRVKHDQSLAHLHESRKYLPCPSCSQEADRRHQTFERPQSSHVRVRSTPPPPLASAEQRPSTATTKDRPSRRPPTPADLNRLSRPKSIPPEQLSNNCNWSNFIKKKSKYAIKTPYGLCDLASGQENREDRPPFLNYGGRYDDKQYGQKRTYNSLAIHQLKHHEVEKQRLRNLLHERRLRLHAENYFRQIEEHKAHAQEIRDRAARSSTEYRDNYRPPQDYNTEETASRR